MKSKSYAKYLQKGSMSSSFGILSIGFGILAWTINFTTQEFKSRNNLDSISSIQSRGAIILSLIDENGGTRDISGDLISIRSRAGGDGDVCVVYFSDGSPISSSDLSCLGLITSDMENAASRSWSQAVLSFDRNSPQTYSLNSVSGPEVSTTLRTSNNTNSEPTCFRIGRAFGCQASGNNSVVVESEFEEALVIPG